MTDPLSPPPILRGAAAQASWVKRAFQGIPSLAVAPGGRLWAAWYGGPRGEDADNAVYLVSSSDSGATWALVLAIDPPDEVRAFDPVLWLDPLGRIWVCWAQSTAPRQSKGQMFDGAAGVWAMRSRDPDAAEPAWEPPRRIADGVMMNKPLVTAGGDWLFPTALWKNLGGGTVPMHLKSAQHANVTVSTDRGEAFIRRGGADAPEPDFDEHMLVERRNGSLWMLIRCRHGLAESSSTDGGTTWSPGRPTAPAIANARFHLRRLRSGRLLLVANRADPAQRDSLAWRKRRNLTAWLSEDDGATWPWALCLDPREGTSYPDADEDAEGRIWLTWDYERYRCGDILLGCVREAEILAGRCELPDSFVGRLLDRSGGVRPG